MFQEEFAKIETACAQIPAEDDRSLMDCWERLAQLVCSHLDEAIEFMRNCTEFQAGMISSVMDDVTIRLRSRRFITALRELDHRFPQLGMGLLIEHDVRSIGDDWLD